MSNPQPDEEKGTLETFYCNNKQTIYFILLLVIGFVGYKYLYPCICEYREKNKPPGPFFDKPT